MISLVEEITPELKALASGPSASGRGGMRTKLEAAEIAMNCGGTAVIANGQARDTIGRIFDGDEIGTAFLPTKRMRGKRRWIAYAADVRGRVVVDAGAHRAITQGKASLLASGIMRVESHFAPMDVVSIVDAEGPRVRARHRQLRQRGGRASLRQKASRSRTQLGSFSCAGNAR